VNAVARKRAFCHEAGQLAVYDQRASVVQRLVVEERQPEAQDEPRVYGKISSNTVRAMACVPGDKNASSQP